MSYQQQSARQKPFAEALRNSPAAFLSPLDQLDFKVGRISSSWATVRHVPAAPPLLPRVSAILYVLLPVICRATRHRACRRNRHPGANAASVARSRGRPCPRISPSVVDRLSDRSAASRVLADAGGRILC